MTIISTQPDSPDISFVYRTRTRVFIIQIFSNMRSYMNLTVLALVAFTVSSVLSAPIRYGSLLVEFKGPLDDWNC